MYIVGTNTISDGGFADIYVTSISQLQPKDTPDDGFWLHVAEVCKVGFLGRRMLSESNCAAQRYRDQLDYGGADSITGIAIICQLITSPTLSGTCGESTLVL